MDKADLIRKLIFQHLASETINEYTWKKITDALKTHKKFIDNNLELEEVHKGFYVTNFNDYHETADDESIKKYLDEYEYNDKRVFPLYDYKRSTATFEHVKKKLDNALLLVIIKV